MCHTSPCHKCVQSNKPFEPIIIDFLYYALRSLPLSQMVTFVKKIEKKSTEHDKRQNVLLLKKFNI